MYLQFHPSAIGTCIISHLFPTSILNGAHGTQYNQDTGIACNSRNYPTSDASNCLIAGKVAKFKMVAVTLAESRLEGYLKKFPVFH